MLYIQPKQGVMFLKTILNNIGSESAPFGQLEPARLNFAVFEQKGFVPSAAVEGQWVRGIKGCVRFALRIAHENAKLIQHLAIIFNYLKTPKILYH